MQHTSVGIGYETPWRQVEVMLKMSADRSEGILEDPVPFVLQTALGDFAVTYEINAFCGDASAMPGPCAELHRNVPDVFNECGIQIMTPPYEGDPEQPKLVPREQWYTVPAVPTETRKRKRAAPALAGTSGSAADDAGGAAAAAQAIRRSANGYGTIRPA